MFTSSIKPRNFIVLLLILMITTYSCSSDGDLTTESINEAVDQEEEVVEEEATEEETTEEETTEEEATEEETTCTNPADFVFNEKDGLVLIEFENAEFSGDWKLKNDGNSHSGSGYMVWEGQQYLNAPGNGLATFKIKIVNAGTYQFIWNSAVKTGNSGSDHNDTWLRFNDATDFYGENNQGTSIVYPKGIGKIPNPEGSSADGWFKIYRSGNNLDFKWQSSTFDNNAHNIFVFFGSPGTYLMEISARSSGHGIDKFVLFKDSVTKQDAISSTEPSVISCD